MKLADRIYFMCIGSGLKVAKYNNTTFISVSGLSWGWWHMPEVGGSLKPKSSRPALSQKKANLAKLMESNKSIR